MSTAIVREAYQSTATATAYDGERFASRAGATFDRLEKRAIAGVLEGALGRDRTARLLDVPCGTGRITELLLGMGFVVLGGDISEAMIGAAREKCKAYAGQVAFQRMDLERLDLPAESFDLVTCVRLMHHLDSGEREAVLKELARVSRRWVLVNVSYSSRYYRLRRAIKRGLGQGVSRQSSTWGEIEREARAAGLRVYQRRFIAPWLSEDMVLLFEKAG
jgi:ubiquinone/menaquinone biosynthesis C-methylase UbiE